MVTLTFFVPVLILSLLQDALDKSVVFSEEDNFTKSKATGLQWNNESNDREDGNREATWTNTGIYLEVLKTHCDLLCLVA